jgi:hypothetical protein
MKEIQKVALNSISDEKATKILFDFDAKYATIDWSQNQASNFNDISQESDMGKAAKVLTKIKTRKGHWALNKKYIATRDIDRTT